MKKGFLFRIFDNTHKRKVLKASSEYKFFVQNYRLFDQASDLQTFADYEGDEFKLIKANIVLQGLINKNAFEEAIKRLGIPAYDQKTCNLKLAELTVDLPYFTEGHRKIYIPFFSRALNEIYLDQGQKLLIEPYHALIKEFAGSIIDGFETYNYELFNSQFTRLIALDGHDNTSRAFYHFDFHTLYFINDQGRLDNRVPLFDRQLKKPQTDHIIDRLAPVVEAYYSNDRQVFLNSLLTQKLISFTLFNKLRKGKRRFSDV